MAAAVAMGAFGAHSLREKLDAYSMAIYEKAVFYHITHALSIILVALLVPLSALTPLASHKICLLFFFGLALFSFSLYALAMTKARWIGMLTPIGGTMLIVGWLMLALLVVRQQ